jgi:hypothetical protein
VVDLAGVLAALPANPRTAADGLQHQLVVDEGAFAPLREFLEEVARSVVL